MIIFFVRVLGPTSGQVIYFLMPDRFNDGDPSNNTRANGIARSGGDRIRSGQPVLFSWRRLSGVSAKLDYLRDLGATSIWMSPIFGNLAVQKYGDGAPAKAGYHGYWVLNFTNVDPHFGSKEEFQDLIAEAKKRGIGTILDVVVNHTADILRPKNGVSDYQYKFSRPYLDANGNSFDDRDYIHRSDFPALDVNTSFPVPPMFRGRKIEG